MTGVLSGGYGLDLNRRIYRGLVRRYNIHVLANSRHTQDSLGIPGNDVQIVYLGVDPDRFDSARIAPVSRDQIGPVAGSPGHPAIPSNAAGIPPESIVFVIVARLEPAKGQSVFLEGMLQTQDPRLNLVQVGGDPDGSEAHRMRAIVASFQAAASGEQGGAGRGGDASRRLHFVPFTPEPERFVAMADIVVHAGLVPESFGLSVVEAMMMGKPVLVHALGGPAETVVDGQCGWHVSQPTPEAFRQGILRALADRPRWPTLGAAARRRALEHFSIQAQVARYQETVLSHLNDPGFSSGTADPPQVRPLSGPQP
jgi:glycosyltransferase involved in cell wall biosynthesis